MVYLVFDTYAGNDYLLGVFSTHDLAELFVEVSEGNCLEIHEFLVDYRVEEVKSATDAA